MSESGDRPGHVFSGGMAVERLRANSEVGDGASVSSTNSNGIAGSTAKRPSATAKFLSRLSFTAKGSEAKNNTDQSAESVEITGHQDGTAEVNDVQRAKVNTLFRKLSFKPPL